RMADRSGQEDKSGYHLTLLARDVEGYRNLLALVTKAHREGFYYKPRIVDFLGLGPRLTTAYSLCRDGSHCLVPLARRAAVLAAHLAVRVVAHHAATLAAAARRAAGRAAPRLVGEAFLRVELLLPRGEQETGAALTAVQGLVAKRH